MLLTCFRAQVATFDGDTSKDDRDYIRENANVVSISPSAHSWRPVAE